LEAKKFVKIFFYFLVTLEAEGIQYSLQTLDNYQKGMKRLVGGKHLFEMNPIFEEINLKK